MMTAAKVSISEQRVRVFVDYQNFTLSLRRTESNFMIDMRPLGVCLAQEALREVDPNASALYQGMNVYSSYDRDTPAGANHRNWFENTLSGFPGVYGTIVERQRKQAGPTCPACHNVISECPSCGGDMRGTEEKGVDTRIVTDMISLAWVGNYDVAVLVSSDRDFIPVVEFLQTRGIKVVHGAFPPQARALTSRCWGSIAIPALREQFRLP
jgi:uncharacterized LabA/DUF88 family protein